MTMTIHHTAEPEANDLRARLDAATGRGQRTKTPTMAAVVRAKGSHLWTADGRRLVDLAAGVLVANLGHDHRGFERAFARYAKGLPRTAYNFLTPIEVEAAERLLASMEGNRNAQKLLWAASGSEGIQKALWAAMHKNPDRKILLATRKGFHGKKGLAGDVSGEESPNPNVRWVPFPTDEIEPKAHYAKELDRLGRDHRDDIALLITEPYLGAAGSYHPPKWYLRMLQDWCRDNDVPFILDEVQSCHGRTGNMYAYQTYGLEPDLIVLGKGLANGEPAAAVVGRADLIDALDYGEASDTFSGNPRACAAVCAALDVFEDEKIVEHARERGVQLRAVLDELKAQFSFVTAVRGEGMVYGIEMRDDDIARECVLEAYRGTGKKGVHFLGPLAGKVLRVSPPLTIRREELYEAHRILSRAWTRVG